MTGKVGYNNASRKVAARARRLEAVLVPLRRRDLTYAQIAEWFRVRGVRVDARAVSRWCQGVIPYERQLATLEKAFGSGNQASMEPADSTHRSNAQKSSSTALPSAEQGQ